LFIRKGTAVIMTSSDLVRLHRAEARRVIRQAILDTKGDLRRIDILHVDRILDLATQTEGHGRMQAPGIDVFRSFDWLRIARPHTQTRFERDYSYRVPRPPQSVSIGETAISLEIQDLSSRKHYTKNIDELDTEALGWPLEVRNWHPGDEFHPAGRSRTKIKTLFQEARVPIWERHGWPVLVSGSEIAWTRNFGAAERFIARNSACGRVLCVFETEAQGQSRESNQAF
jgi:tRNA(Ile)-lysidine synthase